MHQTFPGTECGIFAPSFSLSLSFSRSPLGLPFIFEAAFLWLNLHSSLSLPTPSSSLLLFPFSHFTFQVPETLLLFCLSTYATYPLVILFQSLRISILVIFSNNIGLYAIFSVRGKTSSVFSYKNRLPFRPESVFYFLSNSFQVCSNRRHQHRHRHRQHRIIFHRLF